MTRGERIPEELAALLAQLCDGELTNAESARLENRLRGDQAARRFYLRYMNLHAGLHWLRRSRPATSVPLAGGKQLDTVLRSDERAGTLEVPVAWRTPEMSPSEVSRWPLAWAGRLLPHGTGPHDPPRLERWLDIAPIAIFGCLMLAIGVVAGWWLLGRREATSPIAVNQPAQRTTVEADSPRREPAIATLAGATNCQWLDRSALPVGCTFPAGWPVRLARGVAEFLLASGVRVVVSGPATVVLRDSTVVALEAGCLWIQVPPQATGFRVATPLATVIDLGTELGVRVDAARVVEVHVFRGQAAIAPPSGGVAAGKRLAAGQAMRLASGQPATWSPVALAPALFHRDVHTQVTAADVSPRTDAEGWASLLVDTFDAPKLDESRWQVLHRKPAFEGGRLPTASLQPGAIELVNGGVLLTREDFAATEAEPLRVTAEVQLANAKDIPSLYLDATPADDPAAWPFMTHGIQCVFNFTDPQTGVPVLGVLFGYVGQQRLKFKFLPCPRPQPGGRYRLVAVRYADRVAFQVSRLDGATWTRSVECELPKDYAVGAMRRVAFANLELPNQELALRLNEVAISRKEAISRP
jgi:hypothetical protein